jgi:hypothetical protein
MARKGAWDLTGIDISTLIVPADQYRDSLFIQHSIGSSTQVALGLGEPAVTGKGVQLFTGGSPVAIDGADARKAIYAIGNGGQGTWQQGGLILYTY